MGTAVEVRDRAHVLGAAPARPRVLDGARLPGVLHVASLLLAYPLLLWLGRDMWWRQDEWRIILGHVGTAAHPGDLLAPFDIHWATALQLVYRVVAAVFGTGSYLKFVAMLLLVHLCVVHLLWRVLLRCGADAWVATMLCLAFLLFGAGWEGLYWVLAMGYTLPLALALGSALLADRAALSWRHRLGIGVLTCIGVMTSGPGVALLVVPLLVAARRGGLRRGLSVVAPAAALYALWLALWGSAIFDHPGAAGTGIAATVVQFVWDGVVASLAGLVGASALGVVAVVAIAAWMVMRARRADLPALVPACAAGAVSVFLFIALGRANGGDATTSRYVYEGAALLMPAVALALTALRRRWSLSTPLVVAGLAAVVAHSAALLAVESSVATAEDVHERAVLSAAAYLSRDGSVLPDSLPEPVLGWAVSGADVVAMRDSAILVQLTSLPRDVADEVALRVHVSVSPARPPAALAGTAVFPSVLGGTLQPDPASGCTLASGKDADGFTVAVQYPQSGALRVEAVSPVAIRVFLHGTLSAPDDEARRALVPPGTSQWVDDTAPGSTLLLHVSTGTVRLCG